MKAYLPADDLIDHLRYVTADHPNENGTQPLDHLAAAADVTARSLHRWRATGVPLRTAEEVADRLGEHPALIWGDAYWQACGAAGYPPIRTIADLLVTT